MNREMRRVGERKEEREGERRVKEDVQEREGAEALLPRGHNNKNKTRTAACDRRLSYYSSILREAEVRDSPSWTE